MTDFEQVQQEIIKELSTTFDTISADQVNDLIQAIEAADQVFFVGVGRVLLSLEAIAKRFAHLGIKAHVVGDITEPALTGKDLLIVGSGSGESLFPLAIAKKAKSLQATVAHIGSNSKSSMAAVTDVFVRIPVQTKLNLTDEITSIQPMTSLFEQSLLILGDAIALMLIKEQGIEMADLWQYHANLE